MTIREESTGPAYPGQYPGPHDPLHIWAWAFTRRCPAYHADFQLEQARKKVGPENPGALCNKWGLAFLQDPDLPAAPMPLHRDWLGPPFEGRTVPMVSLRATDLALVFDLRRAIEPQIREARHMLEQRKRRHGIKTAVRADKGPNLDKLLRLLRLMDGDDTAALTNPDPRNAARAKRRDVAEAQTIAAQGYHYFFAISRPIDPPHAY